MNIEKIKKIARKENLAKLRQQINQKWVSEKIINHLERNPHLNLSINDVKSLIIKDDLIASFFAKEPGRQNISEKHILSSLKQIEGIDNFKDADKLKNHYIVNNTLFIFNSDNEKPKDLPVKSLDFHFTYKGKIVVGTQKYTQEAGGAQDNQYRDVQAFLNNTLNMPENYIIIALLDGEYYTADKIQVLKDINSKAIICGIDDIEEELNEKFND
jgi:hypothetical protein